MAGGHAGCGVSSAKPRRYNAPVLRQPQARHNGRGAAGTNSQHHLHPLAEGQDDQGVLRLDLSRDEGCQGRGARSEHGSHQVHGQTPQNLLLPAAARGRVAARGEQHQQLQGQRLERQGQILQAQNPQASRWQEAVHGQPLLQH